MANGYQKIGAGRPAGLVAHTRTSLWWGPDHLLSVERDGYSEGYKRFYFADIQAVTLRRTNRQRNITIFLAIFLASYGALAIAVSGEMRFFFLFMLALFAVPFVINLAKGPGCQTSLRTEVQEEVIPALRRVKKTEKFLAELAEKVKAAQGELPPDLLRVRLSLLGSRPPPISARPPAMP